MLAGASTSSLVRSGTTAPRTAAGKKKSASCATATATKQEDPKPALARAAATGQAGNTARVSHTTPTPVTIRKTRVPGFHSRGLTAANGACRRRHSHSGFRGALRGYPARLTPEGPYAPIGGFSGTAANGPHFHPDAPRNSRCGRRCAACRCLWLNSEREAREPAQVTTCLVEKPAKKGWPVSVTQPLNLIMHGVVTVYVCSKWSQTVLEKHVGAHTNIEFS